jgi:hypothetical protein
MQQVQVLDLNYDWLVLGALVVGVSIVVAVLIAIAAELIRRKK